MGYIEKPKTQGVVKIGHTDFEVHEISRDTGAPGSAAVEYAVLVENPRSLDAQVREKLAERRVPNSEWLRCDVAYAISAIRACNPHILYEEHRSETAIIKGFQQIAEYSAADFERLDSGSQVKA